MKTVVLITGAAGGIGQAICAQLIRRGMQLILADIDEKQLRVLAESLGEDAFPYVVDLTDQESLAGLMTYIESEFGRLDVLINNAAIAVVEAFDTRSVESISRELNINLVAPLILTRLAIPLLKRSNDARVISTVSLGAYFPRPNHRSTAPASSACAAQCSRSVWIWPRRASRSAPSCQPRQTPKCCARKRSKAGQRFTVHCTATIAGRRRTSGVTHARQTVPGTDTETERILGIQSGYAVPQPVAAHHPVAAKAR
ncbi:D-beta-hydroxybutyrate dehydrogenase [Pseudomonas syringae pv. daphniphylli]|uniref:D-beta-hydroxybutyrate dehydrogenase n=1 Tax=Pseudomonas syringae pv. daphniphylli TaxID=264455 RepID=A0A9X0KT39_PSESX|nr:D-beta-hydroxybutyrate dehydrogenase [Pseudomonas syringae pv. daphniphylli]